MTYLIIEDEPALGKTLQTYFSRDEEVWLAATLAKATTIVKTEHPALIILDLGMPDGDGLAWLKRWRAYLTAKVIVLTANDDESTTIAGLDLADDYVVKPVSLKVLKARIAKQLPGESQQFGAVALNLRTGQVTKNGKPVRLTSAEQRLLSLIHI